ncbi:MAG: DUF1957 domain-containing protein [Treponema sp.]|nr:DUF1957 domain-containing protein [Treponema sp.]
MSQKSLVLVIDAHESYIPKNNIDLFQHISDIYIPLLNMMRSLEKDAVPFQIAMVFSVPLCTMLSDPFIQQEYIEWLDKKIELGQHELERCKKSDKMMKTVSLCLEKVKQDKHVFIEVYEQNLLKAFASFAKKGYIHLLATTGTYIFLPHFADMFEVVNAQIETGLYAYKYYFGMPADGFWLPYMGYAKGLEKSLRMYGIDFTVLDTQSLLFSEVTPEKGLFEPVRCSYGITAYGCDQEPELTDKSAYRFNAVYRDKNRDIGYELPAEQLQGIYEKGQERHPTGYCYWKRNTDDAIDVINDGNLDNLYDQEVAYRQAQKDAQAYVTAKRERLTAAESLLQENVSLVCAYDATNLFGENWYEGVYWLEQVIREAVAQGLSVQSFDSLHVDTTKLQKIPLYPSAAFGAGYGEDLLDSTNSWMMRYVRKASERMVELAGFFPNDTGLKARLLNLGARELMLAQSSEWAKMIHEGRNPEYATKRFVDSILAFSQVFESLGSNKVSTEWLTTIEQLHPIFPWMNYRIFSKKK